MPIAMVGDMAQQFNALRNTGTIKTDLARLTQELSSGRVKDVTAHLGEGTARFAGIDYSLDQAAAFLRVGDETAQYLTQVQNVLARVDGLRVETASDLLLIGDGSSDAQVSEAALSARDTFAVMVETLNTRLGDRAILGGAAVDRAPLAAADVMLADLTTAIGGATDAATILAAVDDWFSNPTAGFAVTGYLGDTGAMPEKRVSETRSFTMQARADDPGIVAVLRDAAVAALANDLPTIDIATRRSLLQSAGQGLMTGASGLVAVQARVGYLEAGVADAQAEMNGRKAALAMARNEMISADPFETATALQAVQVQLETHFSALSRMARLNLTRFL